MLNDLSFTEYQLAAWKFAKYPEAGEGSAYALAYTALGLGEAGEVQGKVKKILRDSEGVVTDEHREAIAAELGDVLWYLAATASEIGWSLEEIASANIAKLQSRSDRGVLGGSGDNR